MAKKIFSVLLASLSLALIFSATLVLNYFAKDPLAGADERIRKYRMAEASIEIDLGGSPLPDARVEIEQQKHAFPFGCTLYSYTHMTGPEQELYFKEFHELFNLAVVPYFWRYYEPEPDRPELENTKALVKQFEDSGIMVFGHPLLDSNDVGSPEWLRGEARLEDRIKSRVQREVSDYPEVSGWIVMNEPTIGWGLFPVCKWMVRKGAVDATFDSLSWASEKNPRAVIMVNNYLTSRILDVYGAFHHFGFLPSLLAFKKMQKRMSYPELLARLEKKNPPPYAIGLQSHMHVVEWPLWYTDRVIDQYQKFKRPIYFTEITILSGEHRMINWSKMSASGPWKNLPEREPGQADYAEKFYTLLFSRPEVDGIIWFEFADLHAFLGVPGGLLREDLSRKPSYLKLHHLIKEKWWTRLTVKTDAQGMINFSGFFGSYTARVYDQNGVPQKFEFELVKNSPNRFVFQLAPNPQ